jgi:hypothetical protein
LARHTIHSSETLHMAAHAVERMMDSHDVGRTQVRAARA